MKLAETVTFGGSHLNRAAHLRGDLGQLVENAAARSIVLWRGKVAVTNDGHLVLLKLQHPIWNEEKSAPIFLGLDEDERPLFARELTDWHPAADQASIPDTFADTSRQSHPDMPNAEFAELRLVMSDLTPREAELAATGRSLFEWHRTHQFCSSCGAPSQVAMSGWQRDCPSCCGHHFPRTDPVVIMLVTKGNSVLMGRSPGWPDGMYSLLAGFVEPGETLEAAVRREVFEEAGVRVGDVTYLASQPWPFPSSLMFGCLGIALTDEINIDPVEIEDAIWVSREDMANVFAGQHPLINPPRKGAIAGFLLEKWLADSLK